ncbi:hypothetical protein ACGF5C_27745 [Micromonospora sp. NPDC047620]|uniref:hypothetical protein n=1 Tax=Micromonospora sp. NPDC047620 TaxID=3364251 RepID=UPI0037139E0E
MIDSDPLPASHMVRIYRRRERHIKARGVSSLGFAEAVQALTDAGHLPLRLGSVAAADPPYHFQIFLSADASTVVACLGVDQAHRMIDRE